MYNIIVISQSHNEGTAFICVPIFNYMTSKGKALNQKYETSRKKLISKNPSLEGRLGISEKGVYMHNKKTGFNERVNHRTGSFTGKGAY